MVAFKRFIVKVKNQSKNLTFRIETNFSRECFLIQKKIILFM